MPFVVVVVVVVVDQKKLPMMETRRAIRVMTNPGRGVEAAAKRIGKLTGSTQ